MRRPALVAAVQTAAVGAILVCLAALAALHPLRLDLTPERTFTLSPYTREILGRLRGDVRITAFFSSQGDAIRHEMADLLSLYRDASPRVRVALLDLDRNPATAKRLGVVSYNTAVVEAGDRRERVDLVTEENVTAALLAAAGTPPVPTYFVVGHGERDPRDGDERRGASEAAAALTAEGFRVGVLEGAAEVPADAGLVVVAGPERDLRPPESAALARFLSGGGHALFLCDPGTPATVVALLARFGVELAADVVVDEHGRLLGTDGRSARVAYLNEALLPDPPDVQALLPEAQSLRLVDAAGVRADYLATTAESAWADVDRRASEAGADVPFRPDRDRRGPLPVAAFARIDTTAGGEGRLVVVGDADFATNLHLDALGNRDLLLAAAELVARADALAVSRPAAPAAPIPLTVREARIVLYGAAIVPAALLAAAAAAAARRRRFA